MRKAKTFEALGVIVELLNTACVREDDPDHAEFRRAQKFLERHGGGWADGGAWLGPEEFAKLPRCERCQRPFEGPSGPCQPGAGAYFGAHINGPLRWCEGCGEMFDPATPAGCTYYPGDHRQEGQEDPSPGGIAGAVLDGSYDTPYG